MGKHRKNRKRIELPPIELAPGFLEKTSVVTAVKTTLFAWDTNRFVEHEITNLVEIAKLRENLPMLWLNIDGTPDSSFLAQLGQLFNLHPLALEDVQHPTQRAKVEPFGENLFVVVPMPLKECGPFETEQLAMFVGPSVVITISEQVEGDCLEHVRQRIRLHEGRVRDKGAPYLSFAIIDAVIDNYFPIVNELGDRIDHIEEVVVDSRTAPDMYAIRDAKHDLAKARQAIWPMRDVLTAMMTMEVWFDMEHRIFLRNALDHVMRLIDMLDSERTMASDLMELSIAIANAKLGEVTKVLTMIATIFIPITFIAGVYGMNFDFMPELHWKYGYEFALGLMGLSTLGFMVMFWRRGWFRSSIMSDRAPRK
ncbi:MAG: magnesium/cobalt transporter CorA [Planctomycetota bacterium]|nr:magnesium/cobalt transporter CorA [Planctomycetota bacterium]MDA1261972.1 magnesium/cobalt transporter CorA [Planctomycetota bacterium]